MLQVKKLVGSRQLWMRLQAMSKLLQPLSEVIMAIQAKKATIADVTRYWLYLGRALKQCLEDAEGNLPAGNVDYSTMVVIIKCCNFCISSECDGCCNAAEYIAHCYRAYNTRARDLDDKLCRLALFLDPRVQESCCVQGA